MRKRVSYGQIRRILEDLGFKEIRRPEGVALKHKKSDTIFIFRPYEDDDWLTPAELFIVRSMLDEKGLLEPDSFESLLTQTSA